ncbi:T9SS-dependent M36 family metallopeptidase [Chryseobacterium tructae]|uniref:T9SS-dependent M36 family metallopeptidase n=1 Tax=Chryseobacterium tructae TaxID=1037380 RepID=A0ABV7Y2C3_9FLAO|nr:T9SS-dependent M36 family metallopeptidase [Chryseobacterium tructae]MDN3694049.1 T9SS-dependent M36 family metallopeptidase [Chryseobacterium tructae]
MKNKTLPLLFAVFSVFPAIVFGQDNEKLIKDYISQNKIREYKKSDLNNFIVDNVDPSKSLNGDVVKLIQTYNGLPIYSSVGTALIKDSKVAYYTDNFIKDYVAASAKNASISEKIALKNIAIDLENDKVSSLPIIGFFEKGTDKLTSAKQRLVYISDKNKELRLAYEFIFKEPDTANSWNILIDANTGKILSKINLNLACNFHDGAYGHDHSGSQVNMMPQLQDFYIHDNIQKKNMMFFAPDNASYNVFALPLEAPTFGQRSLVSNPWILASSPEGWHSNVTTHYTITRGNNVYAYDDKDNDEQTFGASPDGGATRNFNFAYDPNGLTYNNLSAATTNLFYISNMVHDIFYKFGFTESARNFQSNNFGNGGLDDDEVFAQSQDGGGFNNANFATYPDNYNPIMQMYLWLGSNRKLWYNAPTDAASRVVNAGIAQFGSQLNDIGITGDVKIPTVLEACTSIPAGELTGKIALIQRGTCGFAIKVKNAETAGAIGAIIYNNAANGATIGNMAGDGVVSPTVTIPSILVAEAEGLFMKDKLDANTTVNTTLRADTKYDGSFDNGIVTHEYGHGISNRLTGDGYSCLNARPYNGNPTYSKEQMGEGWSDFFALMLTNKPGDNSTVARGIGTYPIGQPITGGGIRPEKYSPDFNVNGFTYADTNGMEYSDNGTMVADSHSIGFVWASMLWDLHWKYVEKYGYSSDVTANATNGSSRVLQLIVNGLKLQTCDPSFIEGRNAILAAELAATEGQDKCMIWKVFAKRGLGINASAGDKTNINDQVENFEVPAECATLGTDEITSIKDNKISVYPNPAKDEFYINFPSKTLGKVSVELYDMSGKLVSSEDKISPENKKAISTSRLVNGTYIVKVKGLGFEANSKVIVKK